MDEKEKDTSQQSVVGLGDNRLKGVFSSQEVAKIGVGTTQRKTIQKTYWYAEENEDGEVFVQALNVNYVPSGPKKSVPLDSFLNKFDPEPEFYIHTVYPAMQDLNRTIVRGERHRERGAAYSAEFEFKRATSIDEENVRANFGLGLTYLDRGDVVKANDIFERLVGLEAAFDEKHKHLFNDFGINMRKNRMFKQALAYYLRANDLVSNDDHLFHNIARCYYEMGEIDQCIEYLRKSLVLNPDLAESRQFWMYLKKNGHIAKDDTTVVENISTPAPTEEDKEE